MSYDYIDFLAEGLQGNKQKPNQTNIINNTTNTIINGSNNTVSVISQIQQLPFDVQETAKELLAVLETAIKEKKAPKNLKERFGKLIQNYGHLVPAIGELALKLLNVLF